MKKNILLQILETTSSEIKNCSFSEKNAAKLELQKSAREKQFSILGKFNEIGQNSVRLLSFLLACLSSFASWSQAPNVTDGNPGDWSTVLLNSQLKARTFVHDANNTNDNQFTGGSADPDFIANWHWVLGNTNNKGDITNSGAILVGNILYFFGDRTSINGDAQIGFWFFKQNVLATGPGKPSSPFTGAHEIGDLLILSNFTNGGTQPQLHVYKWVGSGGSDGPLNFEGNATTAKVNSAQVSFTSSGPYPNNQYWTYQSANGKIAENTYEPGAFFEGYINLEDFDIEGCFSSFLLETRNSASVSASLQDFVGGQFDATPNDPTVTPDARCGEGTVELKAACSSDGTIVRWYNAGGTLVGTGPSFITPTLNATTTFYASCYNEDRNCESDKVAVVATVNPNPTANAGADPVAQCPGANGNNFNLNGTVTNGTVLWTVQGATDTASGSIPAGNNTLEDPTVHVNGVGTVTFLLTVTSTSCGNATDTVTVTVNPAAVGPTLKKVEPSLCGPSTGSIEVCNPIATATYNLFLNGTLSTSKPGTAPVIFSNLAAGSNPSVTVTTVTNNVACTSTPTSCSSATTAACPTPDDKIAAPTSIKEEATNDTEKASFTVFPVPFKNQLTVRYNFDKASQVQIEVFNSQGKKILSKKDTSGSLNKEIQLNLNSKTGQNEVYFVKVTTDKGSSVQKVISSR